MSSPASSRKPNRLSRATSPYLLQHAHNPVDWFEWGSAALELARRQDKPILVSIGYSSCHWCHVMERESFENEDIAALMNEHLVCIKVDREERPDIDQVYMEAVQAMGLNGGWPLNVFLTPEQKPFYGGTYFNPKHWSQLIVQLAKSYHERRQEIDQSAEDLTKHLSQSDIARFTKEPGPFHPDEFHQSFSILENRYDGVYGGLDRAPKFVMPSIWMWLLRYHKVTGSPRALEMVLTTLRKLGDGGIYDQLGGGFARYSVDGKWFAPHFEKMLYDNAQLLSLYAEAYRVSPEPRFKEIIEETTAWLNREMKHPDGGYYSALDADSEGEEGRFYTWTEDDLDKELGESAALIKRYYQTSPSGNWEHGRNILHRIDAPAMERTDDLEVARKKLLTSRAKRSRPGLDDKVLTGWNAMLITGFIDCYKTFGDRQYLNAALGISDFIESNLLEGTRCFRAYRGKRSATEGFLEDYAHLIASWIGLYEATFEETWIEKAEAAAQYVMEQFSDDSDGYFFISGSAGEKLIARKKDLFDNVIPSPNAVMARNLFRLGILLDREEWKQAGIEMATNLRQLILQEPNYMSYWGLLAMETTFPFYEVVVTGPDTEQRRRAMASTFQPFAQFMGSSTASRLPLVRDKVDQHKTQIHVCVEKTCRLPVATAEEALQQLSSLPS